ncbi:VTC domain-containing protein [Carboxylicivirga sp. N1Y90]|uniref:VTC domain-containing protein n=1 Tax=Carboxylicivirga fragile TaxID=3417571 RepID=UPI003D343BC6|nr:VTC domain-containing protein [Marinilabiliaceae bacterium N1Y90]
MNVLTNLISFFDTIQLNDTGRVKLLNRIDTKFLLSPKALVDCLSAHIEDYEVVEINNERVLNYETKYFDTSDLNMYYEHHNGKARRYKVRYRRYAESGDQFLEVKYKEKNRTHKQRIAVDGFQSHLSGNNEDFIENVTPYRADELFPSITTKFKRITLVNKKVCERITIDLNINFSNTDSDFELKNCVIVEIKRNKEDVYSSFARTIKEHGFLPLSISKYCLGTVALKDGVKYNRFKPRLRKVDSLMAQEENNHFALVV